MSTFSGIVKRQFMTGNRNSSEIAPPSKPTPPQTTTNPINPSIIEHRKVAPTSLDRIFLTWSGQFKSKSDIPASVNGDVIHRARSYARIRINLGFMLFAAVGSGVFVYLGRKDAREGKTLEKENLEWHRQINEEHKRISGQ